MQAAAVHHDRVALGTAAAPALASLVVDEWTCDTPMVAVPRPEIHVIVRIGGPASGGLDAHVFGARQHAQRKVIRGGLRTITARLHLGATEAVLGVPAAALAGRVVGLEQLWGDAATRRFLDRLSGARTTREAAALVEGAIGDRAAIARPARADPGLVREAAARLSTSDVAAVAAGLGVSERHLRRVFRDAVGVSPKAFARLARFHRALGAARGRRPATWAAIAVATGYYDQAHLISEFRALTGATPRALLGELGDHPVPGSE